VCYDRRVRPFLAASALAPIAPGAEAQDPAPPPPHEAPSATCFPIITSLRYPAPALATNIMGTVTSAVAVDSNGGVAQLEPTGHPLLAAGVQEALLTARFSSGCWGQTVALRFNSRLDQKLDPATPVSVKAASAHAYEIVAPAGVIVVSNFDPAWVFTRKGRFLHRVRAWMSKVRFW